MVHLVHRLYGVDAPESLYLCIYDLNIRGRRVIFGVYETLSDFRHNILSKKNKLINYRYIPSFPNSLSVML